MLHTIHSILNEGGAPLYINIFFVSVLALGVIIDRLVALLLQFRVNPDIFTSTMINLVKSGNVDRAIKYCASTKVAIARVCRAGLLKANRSVLDISSSIEEEMMRVLPNIEKRIASLWALANIATLFGLIGTIFGLITSFKGLEGVSPEEKAAYLARGISEALNNTAVGLTIAVVCMAGHLLLSGLSKKLVHSIELNAATLENFLIQRLEPKVDHVAAPESLRTPGGKQEQERA
ncbi:MAG: MotA/TolQ/ExbB proton channel family protein [Deltaproteobacteria bacterium]|nr:MotA/TolQ/ExbB proton channel family protein [Deltaproteobacteria bacterium]